MKQLKIDTTQVHLFASDELPLWDLTSATAMDIIADRFGFETIDPKPHEELGNGVRFSRGDRPPIAADSVARPIQYIDVRDDRLEISAYGDDDFLDDCLRDFRALLDEVQIATEWMSRPLNVAHETVWIGQLDLRPHDIMHPGWVDITRQITEKSSTAQLESTVSLENFSFRVSFRFRDQVSAGQVIDTPDRSFRLEPREGTPLDHQVWFSFSPLRSNHHIELLQQIEARFRRS